MNTTQRTLGAAAALSLATLLTPLGANASTFKILHTFTNGADGGSPVDGITVDKSGNLYGTAEFGGVNNNGTIFELKKEPSGYVYDVLYSFAGNTDGSNPGARIMIAPTGQLFGTTTTGGGGGGTVFELGGLKGGQRPEKWTYAFTGNGNGYEPSDGDLAFDGHGHVYGTTSAGGTGGYGTVYELTRTKTGFSESVLHSFGPGSGPDGSVPVGGLSFDAAGNLYGTTSQGGSFGYGSVYTLVKTKTGWSENVIYNFQAQTDGETPYSGLTFDKAGNIYGGATDGGGNQGGTIFELTRNGGGWSFSTLYSTPGYGVSGPFRTPYVDANGNVYGTTHCDGEYSAGSIYELTSTPSGWSYNSLHDFTGGTDGGYIFANPVFDASGNIYGTSQVGGGGYGVVWEVTP